MAYLLGYRSSVEWLRISRNTAALPRHWALPMLSLEASRHRLQHHADAFAPLTRPIHLIVSLRDSRRPSAETICHLLTSPDGTYPAIYIERGAYCSTPAFTFLQMANVLDDVELRFLGMELCGRYGFDEKGELFLRPQRCSSKELVDMAQSMTGVRGRKQAGAIAPLVLDGSASPMETALTLILCARQDQGGFGLPLPELNRPIAVTGSAYELWSDDFIVPDLLWDDARLIIEYDSSLHHSAAHRIAHDASRRNVLHELGYRVVSVTADHMRSPRELERIAGIVARAVGMPLEEPDDQIWARRLGWQLRMRELAEHPAKLLGPKKPTRPTRTWHSRYPIPHRSAGNAQS